MRWPLGTWCRNGVLACALVLFGCSSDDGGAGGRGNGNGNDDGSGGDGSSGSGGTTGGPSFGNTDASVTGTGSLPDGGLTGSGGDSPDDRAVCDSAEIVPELETELVPGNVLIVFDRSGSMDDDWGDPPRPKYTDAHQAVTDALTPLVDSVALVGALLFPAGSGGDECVVNAINSGLQFDFVPTATFLSQWAAYWADPLATPGGRTPLRDAQNAADVALLDPALENNTIVIIITDGRPNCAMGGGDEPLMNLTPLPTAWNALGIKTYVVGLPGADDTGSITILDGIADAGGTGTHIPATDSQALQDEIAKIVEEAAVGEAFPCFIDIDPAPENPDDEHVVVTENGMESDVPRKFQDGSEAWTINSDGTHIDFAGDFCAAVQAGTYDNVSVEFGCVSAPPLPPPKPD